MLDVYLDFLRREDVNFIAVDWQLLANQPNYIRAVDHVQLVGTFTGELVKFLVSQRADIRNFHLIGFDLGAHAVGRAGRFNNGAIPMITGQKLITWQSNE